MDTLSLFVVIFTTAIATYTDLRGGIIYRRLTLPVFCTGLIYSVIPYKTYFKFIGMTKAGMYYLVSILWSWLGPSLLIFMYSLFLFWLGILDAGDGHFLIAITSWCGMDRMTAIILWFYPLAFIYLLFYLLKKYEYNWKKLASQQFKDTLVLLKSIPVVLDNIRKSEEHILVKNMPYTSSNVQRPPGMIPLSLAVLFAIL